MSAGSGRRGDYRVVRPRSTEALGDCLDVHPVQAVDVSTRVAAATTGEVVAHANRLVATLGARFDAATRWK